MQFEDAVELGEMRRTNDGYLVADVRTARTGIQIYSGPEMGRPDLPVVRVHRPESQVFDKVSMSSYAGKPITNDHPKNGVSSKSWRDLAVGMVGGEVARDGEFVRVPLMLTDESMIQKVETGKRELSAGYLCDIAWDSGVTDQGEPYDAVQKNIRINHIAIVDRGRAGAACRIGDNATWGTSPKTPNPTQDRSIAVPEIQTRTVLVDGLSVVTTDQGAQAIDKLLKDNSTLTADIDKLRSDHAAAIAAKDKELGEKDTEIDKLKKNALTGDALDKLVDDRAEIVAKAKAIIDNFEPAGKSNADIRRTVVAQKIGDEAVKDRSDDYVEARFDGLTSGLAVDKVAAHLTPGPGQPTQSKPVVTDAYQEYLIGLNTAWSPEGNTNA